MKRLSFFVMLLITMLYGCGIQLDGNWDVSGEFFPGDPFAITLKIEDGQMAPTVHYSDLKGVDRDIAICDFHFDEDTQRFSFSFNPFSKQQDCNTLHQAFLVDGQFGYASFTATIKDANGAIVGRLRGINKTD